MFSKNISLFVYFFNPQLPEEDDIDLSDFDMDDDEEERKDEL